MDVTKPLNVRAKGAKVTAKGTPASRSSAVQDVPVARIRPEEGLGRKRDRDGHRELQHSIEHFGVLTPITVRLAPDASGDYLLIKGQGRTLACRLLGIPTIPAVVVDARYGDDQKVQQFLVENVARLKMRSVDRALLIHRARQDGEETSSIAKRFGVTPSTVRRLLAQLEGASSGEVAALGDGNVNLTAHAVVARHVPPAERIGILGVVARTSISSKDLEVLFSALGWSDLAGLGSIHNSQRLRLFDWACTTFVGLKGRSPRERLRQLALSFPVEFANDGAPVRAVQ
jgi:ParB/RepB/Spo0J family partition protein